MKQISDLYEKIEYPDSGYHFKMWLDKSEKDSDTKDQPQLFHEDIEIKYVLSGTLSVIIDDVMYSLAPGDILIVNPYTFHTNVWLGEPKYSYHLINMSPAFFSEQGYSGLDLHTELYQKQRRFCPVIRGDQALGESCSGRSFRRNAHAVRTGSPSCSNTISAAALSHSPSPLSLYRKFPEKSRCR